MYVLLPETQSLCGSFVLKSVCLIYLNNWRKLRYGIDGGSGFGDCFTDFFTRGGVGQGEANGGLGELAGVADGGEDVGGFVGAGGAR